MSLPQPGHLKPTITTSFCYNIMFFLLINRRGYGREKLHFAVIRIEPSIMLGKVFIAERERERERLLFTELEVEDLNNSSMIPGQ